MFQLIVNEKDKNEFTKFLTARDTGSHWNHILQKLTYRIKTIQDRLSPLKKLGLTYKVKRYKP